MIDIGDGQIPQNISIGTSRVKIVKLYPYSCCVHFKWYHVFYIEEGNKRA